MDLADYSQHGLTTTHSLRNGGAVIGQISILLVDVPRLVADMVTRAIDGQPDMALVGQPTTVSKLLDGGAVPCADVAVVGLDRGGELRLEYRRVLAECPQMKLLGIESGVGQTHLYELRPVQQELGELSVEELVEAIRETAARPPLSESPVQAEGPAP